MRSSFWKRVSSTFVALHCFVGALYFIAARISNALGQIDQNAFYLNAVTSIGIMAIGIAVKTGVDVLSKRR